MASEAMAEGSVIGGVLGVTNIGRLVSYKLMNDEDRDLTCAI
jgi:hypothetical protein